MIKLITLIQFFILSVFSNEGMSVDYSSAWIVHISEDAQEPGIANQSPQYWLKSAHSDRFVNAAFDCYSGQCYVKEELKHEERNILKLWQATWFENQIRDEIKSLGFGENNEQDGRIDEDLPICDGCLIFFKNKNRQKISQEPGSGIITCEGRCRIAFVNGNWVITDESDGTTFIVYSSNCGGQCSFTNTSDPHGRTIQVKTSISWWKKFFCKLGLNIGPIAITNPACY